MISANYSECPPGILPEIRPSSGEFGQTSGLRLPPRRPADPGDRRRPAGFADRPGLRRGRPGQMYLRHGRVPAGAHGWPDRAVPQRADHDPGGHPRRPAAPVCARGERVRRRCGRAVVPRRPQGDRRLVRDQPAVARSRPGDGRRLRAGADRASAHPYWQPEARGTIFGLDARHVDRRPGPRHARRRRLPGGRPDPGDERRTWDIRSPSSGPTAACRAPTRSSSSRRTCSACRSAAVPRPNRRPWGPHSGRTRGRLMARRRRRGRADRIRRPRSSRRPAATIGGARSRSVGAGRSRR